MPFWGSDADDHSALRRRLGGYLSDQPTIEKGVSNSGRQQEGGYPYKGAPYLARKKSDRKPDRSAEAFPTVSDFPLAANTALLASTSQAMVSVCFSLWRAAFLADRIGTRKAVIEDARLFLGKLITDNAVTYPQDRSSREFTFNYYMDNATNGLEFVTTQTRLVLIDNDWSVVTTILTPKPTKAIGLTRYHDRWNKTHEAFEAALKCYDKEIRATHKMWMEEANKLIADCRTLGMDAASIKKALSLAPSAMKKKLGKTASSKKSEIELRRITEFAKDIVEDEL